MLSWWPREVELVDGQQILLAYGTAADIEKARGQAGNAG